MRPTRRDFLASLAAAAACGPPGAAPDAVAPNPSPGGRLVYPYLTALLRRGSPPNAPIAEFLFAGGAVPAPLIFERASPGYSARVGTNSVQTAASHPASGYGSNDAPRFGRNTDGEPLGLLIEHAAQNWLSSARGFTGPSWAGAGTYVYGPDAAAGPDGQVRATRLQVTSGNVGVFTNAPWTGLRLIASAWVKQFAAGSPANILLGSLDAGRFDAAEIVSTALWQQIAALNVRYGSPYNVYFRLPSGTDMRALGGIAGAVARDYLEDLHQVEQGDIVTEAIVSAGTSLSRAGERLRHPSVAALLSTGGAFTPEFEFRPKGRPSEYVGTPHLFYRGASDFARIDPATQRLTFALGGVAWTPSAPVSWERHQRVWWVLRGGGGLPRRALYCVEGGAPVDLGEGPTDAALAWTGSVDLYSSGTAEQLTSRVDAVRFFS